MLLFVCLHFYLIWESIHTLHSCTSWHNICLWTHKTIKIKKIQEEALRHIQTHTHTHTHTPLTYQNCAYGNFPIGQIGNQHRSTQKTNVFLDLQGFKHTHTHTLIATSCHLSTHLLQLYLHTPLGSLAAQSHSHTHTHTHTFGSAHTCTRTYTCTFRHTLVGAHTQHEHSRTHTHPHGRTHTHSQP